MTTKVDYTNNLMEDSHDGAAEEAFSDLMDTFVMTRWGLARTLTWTHMRGLAFHFGGLIHLGAITSNSLHCRESGPRKHLLTIWETEEHTQGGAVLKCRASLVREAVLDFSSTTYARLPTKDAHINFIYSKRQGLRDEHVRRAEGECPSRGPPEARIMWHMYLHGEYVCPREGK
jgi:hypothetical protein